MLPPALAVLVAALALSGCLADGPRDEWTPGPAGGEWVGGMVEFPAVRVDTDLGSFTAILYPDAAPETVALYEAYVQEEYFTNRFFGRIIPGFVIQVTDMTGATEDDRTVPLETTDEHHFAAGALGIARSADPNSGGAEWFVMDYATGHLDGNYTVWGQVVEGLHVVHQIARGPALELNDIRTLPPDPVGPLPIYDRIAVPPTFIRGITPLTWTMTPDEADTYPREVAQNFEEGGFRHTMDWPRDLRAGAAGQLTWFVRPTEGGDLPDRDRLRIVVDGHDVAFVGDAEAEGAFHFMWTPQSHGAKRATMLLDDSPWGELIIDVDPA